GRRIAAPRTALATVPAVIATIATATVAAATVIAAGSVSARAGARAAATITAPVSIVPTATILGMGRGDEMAKHDAGGTAWGHCGNRQKNDDEPGAARGHLSTGLLAESSRSSFDRP